VPWESVVDERNDPPEWNEGEPDDDGDSDDDDAIVRVSAGAFHIDDYGKLAIYPKRKAIPCLRQPYLIIIVAEKTSVRPIVEPIAERYGAVMMLFKGNASDTYVYQLTKYAAEDGRRAVIFYLSDCDPSGYEMAVTISRKMQAHKHFNFPQLQIHVRPIALTVEQVRSLGLPSTPLSDKEKRADKWREAWGVEQTEIDALAALQPDTLRQIIEDAIAPFYDKTLDRRVEAATDAYNKMARDTLNEVLRNPEIAERVGEVQADIDPKLEEMTALKDDIETLTGELAEAIEAEMSDVPMPEQPQPETNARTAGLPLFLSDWDFDSASERLKAYRRYESIIGDVADE
jgi:hypothetical protein